MKKFRHIILALTALILASCAVDEFWEGMDHAEGEEVVMTFKPKFEDFESVTKAIGDGKKVDKLLVQVYDELGKTPVFSKEYGKDDWKKVQIAFYYGKTYTVYFWAYNSERNPYKIAEGGLKNGVTVTYPDEKQNLAYDALEHLDAFYAVETINLSDDIADNTKPSLTRPFAQVNLVADKEELETAKATKVEFTIDAADSFVPGGEALSSQSRTFTFKDEDFFFQKNEEISKGKAYLGTTYLFVPSNGSLEAKVTLYDSMDNKLKGPSTVTIPLASNQRTNLVFTDVEPAWDDDAMDVPEPSNGWIHIETPEQMAAFLLEGPAEGAKVHVCLDINMGGLPQKYHEAIAARKFTDLTLYGGALESGNPVGGSSHMISNFTAPAFLANAAGLTVSNLVLDNFKVEGNGHVGTLVNTLKGSSTFTNVTVSNSSATTSNGAAGGIVGYIERKDPTDRSEELEVAFYGCSVNGSQDKPVANANSTDAEGKFVGKFSGYDYREKLTFDNYCTATEDTKVTNYPSRYTEKNEGEWLETNDYTQYNGFLGEETYNRGTIILGENQFIPMWDGKKVVTPLSADSTYDGWESGTVIYSAFDLAYLSGKSLTSGNYYLLADVDLGGDGKDGIVGKLDKDRKMEDCGQDDAIFTPIKNIIYLNGVKKDKISTQQTELTETDNNTIFNCKVVMGKHDGIGAGFIQSTTGTTHHYNINLKRAYVYNHHDESIPEMNYWDEEDVGSGNAYAGTFLSTTGGSKYTISNVHVSNGHVFALCKIGGMIGRVNVNMDMINCSVDNHIVENYEANIINWYPMAMTVSSFVVYVNESWYTQGECGGLIGFVKSPSALIDNCSVTNTNMKCYGQPDKPVTAGVFLADSWTSIQSAGSNPSKNALIKGKTIIAGRHVNQFIGDVVSGRSESRANSDDYTITIRDYYVSGNKYFGVPAENASTKTLQEIKSESVPKTILFDPSPKSHAYAFTTSTRTTGNWLKTYYYTHTTSLCNCVGSAYYVGVDVYVNAIIAKIDKHVKDCAGKLVFNEKGKPAVTVTEAIKDGNNIAWTGGDFWM